MAISSGIDIIEAARIKKAALRGRFLKRVFTEKEVACAGKNPGGRLAAVFAAKEACVKALSIGPGSGVSWKDIEVISDGGGPSLKLHNAAKELLGSRKAFLSISSAAGMVAAFVVVE